MPRGRSKNTPVQETPHGDPSLRDQAPPTEHEVGHTEQSGPQAPAETALSYEETASVGGEPHQEESPETLPGYLAANIREDIRAFMQNFGITGHQPESVYDSIVGISEQIRGEQSAADSHADRQEQVPAPDEQQSPVPLNVRITSLEMDGSTRAFAAADYGDLTINRIRVKQDEYGTLSVSMPRYRQSTGWKDTCAFNTVESRNRLTGAVLDAYEQQLAQIQGQGQTETGAHEQDQYAGQDETHDMDSQEQDGSGMSMGMNMSQ